ncbi:MAG: SDR family NAD(P)-dependent oxidoreductase [bacterium]
MSQTALVTGGGRGIGRAVVNRFFEDNWTVIVHYNQSEESAVAASQEGDGEVFQANLQTEAGIETLSSFIEETSVNVLVNNAGVVNGLDPESLTLKDWERTFRVNASAPAVLCRSAAESMEPGGRIVNVGSVRGLRHSSRPGISAYCASKAAVENMTASLSQHYAPEIRINAVAPGFTDTDMTAGIDEGTRREIEGKTPMDRFGEPEEIAEAIRFLCSSRCEFLTGETLVVDGGYSIRG